MRGLGGQVGCGQRGKVLRIVREWDKTAGATVQGVDGAGFDVVDPAVEVQPVLIQGQGDGGVGLTCRGYLGQWALLK